VRRGRGVLAECAAARFFGLYPGNTAEARDDRALRRGLSLAAGTRLYGQDEARQARRVPAALYRGRVVADGAAGYDEYHPYWRYAAPRPHIPGRHRHGASRSVQRPIYG